MTATQELTLTERPKRGSMPGFYRRVVNMLIDQGWHFIPGDAGNKHKLIPPDPTKRIVLVAATPSDSYRGATKWISQLRRSGAILDDKELERLAKSDSRRRLRQSLRDSTDGAPVENLPEIEPVTTHGAWWRPTQPQEAPVEPAEAPVEAPRPIPSGPDPDARGANYTLAQARTLLRQGYHVKKVVQRTGWGRNWFSDLVDATGYYSPGTM